VRQMQLVENAVVTFVRRGRPDVVADRLVLEITLPAVFCAVGFVHLQVLGLDLGKDPAVRKDGVDGGLQ